MSEKEQDEAVQKIISEMENNLSVLSWMGSQHDAETQEHIKALKAALRDTKKDLVHA